MNLYEYIVHKGLEKAQAEVIKQMIWNDPSLTYQQKATWLNTIDAYSKAKDFKDSLPVFREGTKNQEQTRKGISLSEEGQDFIRSNRKDDRAIKRFYSER